MTTTVIVEQSAGIESVEADWSSRAAHATIASNRELLIGELQQQLEQEEALSEAAVRRTEDATANVDEHTLLYSRVELGKLNLATNLCASTRRVAGNFSPGAGKSP